MGKPWTGSGIQTGLQGVVPFEVGISGGYEVGAAVVALVEGIRVARSGTVTSRSFVIMK